MRVSELLTVMGHLSVGNDNVTPTERAIFLQYLNLVHLQLYQETANFNQDLLIMESFPPQQAGQEQAAADQVDGGQKPYTITLSKMPYLVSSVYTLTDKKPLRRLSVGEAADLTLTQSLSGASAPGTGTPLAYSFQKNIISFIPDPPSPIPVIVWYVPQPSPLSEETEEGDIPYPAAYHPVLADGALYYLFQEEGGFKDSQKDIQARVRWETGKSRLLSYLYCSGGQTFSTFSSV
jgi:hypothetical protein